VSSYYKYISVLILLQIQDRSLAAVAPLFPNLTLLAKLGTAPNYDDF